jgi:hypothetical protein
MKVLKKKFLIITAADSNCGDFVIKHWLKSLMDTTNLSQIDIAILDYGLTKEQKSILSKNAKVINCVRDGHVVNIRYRDVLNFLRKNEYAQVLACDGGDIIFQRDIAFLFEKNKTKFRATFENLESNFLEYLLEFDPFPKDLEKEIVKTLKNKKIINGGLIVAPSNKFKHLCENMNKWIKNKNIYGPDQVILNYTLYHEGFVPLSSSLNYVVHNNAEFKLKNGIFFDEYGEKIFVVHNTGRYNWIRAIKNFGHGPNYNQFSWMKYFLLRLFVRLKLFNVPKYLLIIKKRLEST